MECFNKIKKFKIKKSLFRIEKYPYRILELQLNNRMKNRDYVDIVNLIHSTMKDFKDRIIFDNNSIIYRTQQPISFEILYVNKQVSFNFAINELDSLYFKNRLQSILPNSTLSFKDDYIDLFKNSKVYSYNYEKHFMYSLNCSESPVNNLIALKKDICNNENLLIQTIINPISDTWKTEVYENWKKLKKGIDIPSNNSWIINILNFINNMLNEFCNIIDDTLGYTSKNNNNNSYNKISNDLTSYSKQKINSDGFKINLCSIIKTSNSLQFNNLSRSIETCYKELDGDNNLILNKKVKKITNNNIKNFKYRNFNNIQNIFNKNIMNSNELSSLLKLPDGVSQRRYGLKSIKYNQIKVPKIMKVGNISLGSVVYHGENVNIYLPMDKNISCLPLLLLTKMGGGKTSELLNIANDSIKSHDSLVVFDYIRDLQLSQSLINLYSDKIKVFKLGYKDINLPSFAFPEIEIQEYDSPFEKKIKAGIIATEIKYMLNSMATDTTGLTRIMSKYLTAACKIVFCQKEKTLNDLLSVLEDEHTRNVYITNAINSNIFHMDSREILILKSLNDKNNKIDGLLDRFSVITENTLFSAMLDKSYYDNINFAKLMDENKPIVIQLPQEIFTNKLDKDTICTYFMSRIRLAMSVRKNYNKICRIIIDEPHQIPKTINLMTDTIAEPRKFGIQYIMGLHSFEQLPTRMKDVIIEVGCNFMLLKGVSNKTFNELRDYIDESILYEDIVEMNYDYGALYLFNINNKYNSFIGALRKPLKINNELCIGN